MTTFIPIAWHQLLIALGLVGISGAASLYYHLKLERDLLVGVCRTFAQLLAMGYLLKLLFGLNNALLVIAVYLLMTFISVHIVHGRVKEKQVAYFAPTTLAVMLSYSLITIVVTKVIIGAEPWWSPQYFIPIGGMVAGNSMNALSLTLERFFSELHTKRDQVEMYLCYGADYKEATESIFRTSLKAGMIPAINSMMSVGLVSLPGMMTGQILAGADPQDAVRYQIVVMLMLVGSTALTSILVLLLVRKRCFTAAMTLFLKKDRSVE
ncbi:iron export ABC transporter permease subunit FetB [Halodesulfovibrio sp.]|jgi:putative ABC transport system permease protein|uniref:ABC transporter permease n=1 Tax=Halodesulfovibrio sp. TaxID=1912772 RepID=UPI0025F1EC8A|nr:iron export ABC transporter permease subunit FetB [Halodesulfovibrio sp.]MCT4534305.1 iron export ABC transporter permease subunit FetB [Halodesulfovibrio sp.]